MKDFNVLRSIPEVAAIDHERLQAYCNEWVDRPIAQKFGIGFLLVDRAKYLQLCLDSRRFSVNDNRGIELPFDQLVGYIIDKHFGDPEERRRLHAQLREVRHRWPEENYEADVGIGRIGRVYVVCKNPACGVWIETSYKFVHGKKINTPPITVPCPKCGVSDTYDGNDCRVIVDN